MDTEPLHLPARDGYDRWAAIYDDEDNPLIALEEPRLPGLLGDVEGLDVLDLGSGTGRHALRMAAAGARVTALDFSDGMVGRARGKPGWDRVRFIAHDLTRPLPLADRSFDRVVGCLVLEHLSDLGAVLSECRRVCRPRGFVLISELHPAMRLHGIAGARFVDPATGRTTYPAGHRHEISDYVMAAVRSGLTVDHISEHVVDPDLAARSARAAKYLGWPMLLLLRFRA